MNKVIWGFCFLGFLSISCQTTSEADFQQSPRITDYKPTYYNTAEVLGNIEEKIQQDIQQKKITPITELRKKCPKQIQKTSLPIPQCNYLPLSTPLELYQTRGNSVMVVGSLFNCGKCSKMHPNASSGFIISSTGLMVTNYHVINNEKDLYLAAFDNTGKKYNIKKIEAVDPLADIAILQLEGDKFPPPLPLAVNNPVGSHVYVISHPQHNFYTMTEGIISRYFQIYTKNNKLNNENSLHRMAVTADWGGGSSGAPVFNHAGEVIGLVSATNTISARPTDQHGISTTQMVMKIAIPSDSILNLFAKTSQDENIPVNKK